jgi:hypothetical protein
MLFLLLFLYEQIEIEFYLILKNFYPEKKTRKIASRTFSFTFISTVTTMLCYFGWIRMRLYIYSALLPFYTKAVNIAEQRRSYEICVFTFYYNCYCFSSFLFSFYTSFFTPQQLNFSRLFVVSYVLLACLLKSSFLSLYIYSLTISCIFRHLKLFLFLCIFLYVKKNLINVIWKK